MSARRRGPATESTAGSLLFSDAETGDTHSASFVANGSGYVGTFSLDPISEAGGTGSPPPGTTP